MIDDRVLDVLKTGQVSQVGLRFAAVTQASPLRIKLDGDTTALPYTPYSLEKAALNVDDRVLCAVVGTTLLVMGAVASYEQPYRDLWTGSVNSVGSTLNLAESLTNFKQVSFLYSINTEQRVERYFDIETLPSHFGFDFTNVSDTAGNIYMYLHEVSIGITSNTQLNLTRHSLVTWTGVSTASATRGESSTSFTVLRVRGWR